MVRWLFVLWFRGIIEKKWKKGASIFCDFFHVEITYNVIAQYYSGAK